MAPNFDDSFKKNTSGLSRSDKKEFQNQIYNSKNSLSDAEARAFQKILQKDKNDKRKYSEKKEFKEGAYLSEIKNYIDNTRNILIDSLCFKQEEKDAIEFLLRNMKDVRSVKVFFYFVFVTIDYKFFIEEKISREIAFEAKSHFLLGISDFKQISHESKKTVLYRMLDILNEYAFYAYTSSDIDQIYKANMLLATLGSVISIASSDFGDKTGYGALWMECILDPHNPNKRFMYYISRAKAETEEFRYIYDFYFKHEGKMNFKSQITKHLTNAEKEKMLQEKQKLDSERKLSNRSLKNMTQDKKIGKMMNIRGDVLANKLSSLKKRGDYY